MANPFRTRRRIEFVDTDLAGIVHFSNFFRFMESAEQDFLLSLGLSVQPTWEGESLGFPRVSASCDYKAPVRFMDMLDIDVSIRNVGRKSVTYLFEFYKSDEKVAQGSITAVCCKHLPDGSIQSQEIPASLARFLREQQGSA